MWFTAAYPAAESAWSNQQTNPPPAASAPRIPRPAITAGGLVYWPGGTAYEALAEVAAALNYRLHIPQGQGIVQMLMAQALTSVQSGVMPVQSLAKATGDTFPQLLVTMNMRNHELVVQRLSDAQNAPTFHRAAVAVPVQHPPVRCTETASLQKNSAAQSPASKTDPALLRGVRLHRGNLQSVLTEISAVTGYRVQSTPDIPMGTVGDGLLWDRLQPALGVLRQLGKQGYLDIQVFPGRRLIAVHIHL
ncbi:hypothetical protein JKG47_02990 [Acidithiobacillus sp. MC6.1]|nr:hypothetical protein [Acidithiobacillus sp. MC6.1]